MSYHENGSFPPLHSWLPKLDIYIVIRGKSSFAICLTHFLNFLMAESSLLPSISVALFGGDQRTIQKNLFIPAISLYCHLFHIYICAAAFHSHLSCLYIFDLLPFHIEIAL